MIGHPVLVTAPLVEPLELSDVKSHLRVDFTTDDDYINALIPVARRQVEAETRRKLITQTWDYYLDGFPFADHIRLPFGSLQSATSLKYVDSTDAETTVATTVYDTVTWEDPGKIILAYNKTWPSPTLRTAGGVIIRFVCGYGATGSSVPDELLHSMKLRIGHWYENREEVAIGQGIVQLEVPNSAKALAWPYRIDLV